MSRSTDIYAVPRTTPQTEKARDDQILNAAGGYTFATTDEERLLRFLILGTTEGTFYVSAQEQTRKEVAFLTGYAAHDPVTYLGHVRAVSFEGRALSNDHAIYALAVAMTSASAKARKLARPLVTTVCRTGTHILHLVAFIDALGGWCRGNRTAVERWYLDRIDDDTLSYQFLKYRQRDGWSHRDVLRVVHPRAQTPKGKALMAWVAHEEDVPEDEKIEIAERIKVVPPKEVAALVGDHPWITHEMIPSETRNDTVWKALALNMPVLATIRQLPNLTARNILGYWTGDEFLINRVVDRITNRDLLKRARVHPLRLLFAWASYRTGRNRNLTWEANPKITDALEAAFMSSFDLLEPITASVLIGLDISGSMWGGSPVVKPAEAGTAVALALAKQTANHTAVLGFDTQIRHLGITKNDNFHSALDKVRSNTFGGTDASKLYTFAAQRSSHVDTFITITDNETWAGNEHPYEVLALYRRKVNPNAKALSLAMTATQNTICDPTDPLSLNIVGLDANVATAVDQFIRL